ncbi:MAG: hypothetical protein ACKVZH_23765 [Blastocatellia bacterium]
MADEPIIIKPGAYPIPGKSDVMGLCVVLNDAEANWKVTEKADGSITVNIPEDSPWRVNRAEDADKPGSHYLQVFRVDGSINAIVLQSFVHPTDDVHTPNADHPMDKPPQFKIFYTNPDSAYVYEVAEESKNNNSKKK